MRQAINEYLKARNGFKLTEREDDPMDVDFVHKGSRRARRKETTRAKEGAKAKVKERANTMGRKVCWERQAESRNVPRNSHETCGKTRHKWSECWAKSGGAAKQANSVGKTDENW